MSKFPTSDWMMGPVPCSFSECRPSNSVRRASARDADLRAPYRCRSGTVFARVLCVAHGGGRGVTRRGRRRRRTERVQSCTRFVMVLSSTSIATAPSCRGVDEVEIEREDEALRGTLLLTCVTVTSTSLPFAVKATFTSDGRRRTRCLRTPSRGRRRRLRGSFSELLRLPLRTRVIEPVVEELRHLVFARMRSICRRHSAPSDKGSIGASEIDDR